MEQLKRLVHDVPDFPIPGVTFRDITPLLLDPIALGQVVGHLAERFRNAHIDVVAGIESRGFLFGTPLALALGAGFVPVRKPGKLPRGTVREAYDLEYGTNQLEMHEDAIRGSQRVLVVDDVLATGGTAAASTRLVRRLGGEVVGAAFVIEIAALEGRARIADLDICALLAY
jgi:adenine phosphoribosyltransferase